MEFDLEDPLAAAPAEGWEEDGGGAPDGRSPSDSAAALFAAEPDHVCFPGTLDGDGAARVSVRRDAVSTLLQAPGNGCSDPFIIYLAGNYVDRFISCEAIPRDKPWIARLLAVACLSLACKMKKTDFSAAEFQAEGGVIYEGRTIRRMESMVLRALQWRMRSITPFSFLRFFLSLFRPADASLLSALKTRASDILFRAQYETKLLGCRPSAVAASALLAACQELYPLHLPCFRDSISSCSYLDKEEARKCCVAMGEIAAAGTCDAGAAVSSCCDTPVTVLRRHHRHCSSSESECPAVGGSVDRDLKKRRTGGLTGEHCGGVLRSPAEK